MVRPSTILPFGAVDHRPDYDYADGVTFRAYELADVDKLTCAVSTPQRPEPLYLDVQRTGRRVTASVTGDTSVRWQLQLVGVQSVTAHSGACTMLDARGILLQPAEGSHQFEFEL